jgi:capsid portal protein
VIRNVNNEVVFLRHLDSSTMRLVKLDNPVAVERTIDRDGDIFKATIWVRERRFVQRVGTNYIYYKEFGSERRLDRETGAWIDGGSGQTGFPQINPGAPYGKAKDSTALLTLKADFNQQRQMDNGVAPGPAATQRPANLTNPDGTQKLNLASEVIHFICDKDATTPYGIPRWINNLPAVLGSRKAEEFNLDFFDAGGLPPAIIFIQGGALADSVKQQLLAYLGGNFKDKQRAAVIEAQSSSGSLDSAGQVKVTTERFGDNRANGTDSMFQVYDEKCENHVRGAFRMPSIFLGKANDYNFATALTAVMVTEAQVFSPERKEFDEKINHTIVRALGAKRYKFKSLPITLKNVDIQLKSLALVMDKVSGEDLVDTINQITGLSLTYDATTAAQAQQQQAMQAQAKGAVANGGDPFNSMQPQGQKKNPFASGLGSASSGGMGDSGMGSVAMKSDLTSNDIVTLAGEWATAVGLTDGPRMEKELRRAVVQKVESLNVDQRKLFDAVVATSTFARSSLDAEGLTELAGCCVGLMDH